MADHILIDTKATAGEWCFYVIDRDDGDDERDPSSVQCHAEGGGIEWRVYFETLAEAEAETGLTLAPGLTPPPEPVEYDDAS
jgi:hypothetical protein